MILRIGCEDEGSLKGSAKKPRCSSYFAFILHPDLSQPASPGEHILHLIRRAYPVSLCSMFLNSIDSIVMVNPYISISMPMNKPITHKPVAGQPSVMNAPRARSPSTQNTNQHNVRSS